MKKRGMLDIFKTVQEETCQQLEEIKDFVMSLKPSISPGEIKDGHLVFNVKLESEKKDETKRIATGCDCLPSNKHD